jgi:tetratricopeptide (TPR) repeat protein
MSFFRRLKWGAGVAFAALCLAQACPADPAASPSPAQPASTPVAARMTPAERAALQAGVEAMAAKKFEAAETSFLKLLELSPDNVTALVNLGIVEFRLGRSDQAQQYLERAVGLMPLKPESATAWMILGLIYNNQNNTEAATAALAQAAYLAPTSPQAHNYFAVVLSKRGWYSAAEDELQRAIQLAPDFAEAHFNLALVYMQLDPPSVELARRHYQRALDLGAAPDSDLQAKLDAAPAPTSLP